MPHESTAVGADVSPALPHATVERLLERFGFSHAPAADRAGLGALYRAWCEHVPFDNIAKRIHLHAGDPALPASTPAAFLDSFLGHGCGATCWGGAGALHALAVALGFEARRGVATMLAAPHLPPNHGTVVVALDGVDWLLDTSMMSCEPIRLDPGAPGSIDHPHWGVDTRLEQGRFHMRWRAVHRDAPMDCRLEHVGAPASEYHARHEATRGWSPFNYELTINVIRDGVRSGIAMGRRAWFEADGRLCTEPVDLDGQRAFLVDVAGISEALAMRLPRDVPTPAPPSVR